ncbi:nucleic acid-binding protein [Schizophyllum commune]
MILTRLLPRLVSSSAHSYSSISAPPLSYFYPSFLQLFTPNFTSNPAPVRKMPFHAAADALQSPLKDLVLKVDAPDYAGRTEKDKAEVAQWVEKVAKGEVRKEADLKDLNATLTPRTFAVANTLTAADVALYGALHPVLSQLQPAQYYAVPAVTRHFDHIQHLPPVRAVADPLAPAFAVVPFDLENAPKQERVQEAPRKKEKKPAAAAASTSEAAPAAADKPAAGEKQAAKKEKKEKKPKEGQPTEKKVKEKKAAPAPEEPAEPAPSMIDLRVGRIVEVEKHPDADGLYVEKIDIGEETGPRTVVSGLVKYIPIEQMRDKWLIAVCNLKPATMRGVKSFAMVLCATHPDGKEAGIEIVNPPEGSKPGDRVFFEGFEDKQPLSQLNPKKKIFETIQPDFTTLESREAAWVDPKTKSVHRIRTEKGVCAAPTFVGASLS